MDTGGISFLQNAGQVAYMERSVSDNNVCYFILDFYEAFQPIVTWTNCVSLFSVLEKVPGSKDMIGALILIFT